MLDLYNPTLIWCCAGLTPDCTSICSGVDSNVGEIIVTSIETILSQPSLMPSNPSIYDNLQAHIRRGPSVPMAQPPPSMEVGTLVPHESYVSPASGVESINMYHLNNRNVNDSSLSLNEPAYLLEETRHYSASPHATHWGMSDTDPSMKPDHGMGFAEDEFDEVRQLNEHPIYPYRQGASSGSLSDVGPYTHQRDGKFTWSNDALLQKRVSERERGIGRQSHAYLTWFLSYVLNSLTTDLPW